MSIESYQMRWEIDDTHKTEVECAREIYQKGIINLYLTTKKRCNIFASLANGDSKGVNINITYIKCKSKSHF